MNGRHLFFALSVVLFFNSPSAVAGTKKIGLTVPVKYEGGTLPMSQGRIKATVDEDEVALLHGNRKLAIPAQNITAVTCGTELHRRFGASVLGMVPGMHLDKTESHYIGLSWTGEKAEKTEVVLKLTTGEYRDFLAALERLTGRKAVDTGKVPTTVRYEL
jgi:hypothetical protein